MHYHRTCEAWLRNLDAHRDEVAAVLERTYGAVDARRFRNLWRVFFLARSELFRYRGGSEWLVSHRLLARRRDTRPQAA